MTWIRDEVDIPSKIKYGLWRLSNNRYPLKLRLKSGSRFILRPKPFRDSMIAHEIFVARIYTIPPEMTQPTVRLIIDIGSNVGYSCVWWMSNYPEANVIAYEPHPAHAQQIEKHIALNKWNKCVQLVPKAASAGNGPMYLTDDEFASKVNNLDDGRSIAIEMVDWFIDMADKHIDILKIDIEGSEHVLLGDDRFGKLNVNICVLEWHNTPEYPDSRVWCLDRLKMFGYQCRLGHTETENGLIWACKR